MPPLRLLDLNLLKALDALIDEQSVSRAAEKLSVTQSAMSGMLARLRECFGEPLFVRGQYGMMPTARTLALQKPLKQILADIHHLWQPPEFDPAEADMTFYLGATDATFHSIAAPFLAVVKRYAPNIRIALLPLGSSEAVSLQLGKGELDVALVTPNERFADFRTRRLYDERYVCVMRADHPLAGRLDLDRFCEADHALVSYQGEPFNGLIDDMLAKSGRRRRVSLSVSSFLILPDILRSGDWIATVPERLVWDSPGLFRCAPPLEVPGFSKLMVWHERTHHSAGHQWLRQQLWQSAEMKRQHM
ncbi:MAG: LysR family transcriptional regulator [Neisseria sp.]|uniref:LysR family transcriptional regulator n=1 Tax=Neisseria sp. TaxID=192066 RepID=UPI0026DBEB61|nr:LysR family transcriptional regulator [Neisseria sp.]MDO4641720.1 LysR family transcriptional regulator [Neisseria sp.]